MIGDIIFGYIFLDSQYYRLNALVLLLLVNRDYVNQEIINELVHLVMERTNDPRLGNNI